MILKTKELANPIEINIPTYSIFFEGDIVEILNKPDHTNYHDVVIGNRYRVRLVIPSAYSNNTAVYLEGSPYYTPRHHGVALYKRPTINWFKFILTLITKNYNP
jgi:hypothetical protein